MFGILKGFVHIWYFSQYFFNQFSILASHIIRAILCDIQGKYNLKLSLHIFIFASWDNQKKITRKQMVEVRK